MAQYQIVYGPLALRALEGKSPQQRQKIEKAVEKWAENPPANIGDHTTNQIPIPGGRATCTVRHSQARIRIITVLSIA